MATQPGAAGGDCGSVVEKSMSENNERSHRWWLSDGFLGALVVLLTAATAFANYQSTLSGIKGNDLDFEGQKKLIVAIGGFLNGNAELIQDLQAYDAYRYLSVEDPAEAALYVDRMSPRLRAELDRPGSPFDEEYLEATYAEARALIAQVDELENAANRIDDKNRLYELAGLIFAIGLAATAWASLVHSERRIRVIFLLVALICLVSGIVAISRVSSV